MKTLEIRKEMLLIENEYNKFRMLVNSMKKIKSSSSSKISLWFFIPINEDIRIPIWFSAKYDKKEIKEWITIYNYDNITEKNSLERVKEFNNIYADIFDASKFVKEMIKGYKHDKNR